VDSVASRNGEIQVRRRSASDFDACEGLARAVHAADGYPPYLPDGDFTGFTSSPDAIDAWVATKQGAVLGHVALHRTSSPPVIRLATSELSVEATRLAVVARLLVAPEARRHGIGRLLLERAARAAYDRGLQPILDVATRFAAAVSLYERSRWRRLGTVSVEFPDGTAIEEFVYQAPQPHTPE